MVSTKLVPLLGLYVFVLHAILPHAVPPVAVAVSLSTDKDTLLAVPGSNLFSSTTYTYGEIIKLLIMSYNQ